MIAKRAQSSAVPSKNGAGANAMRVRDEAWLKQADPGSGPG